MISSSGVIVAFGWSCGEEAEEEEEEEEEEKRGVAVGGRGRKGLGSSTRGRI